MKNYKFKINGRDYEVAINGIEGQNANVSVNGVDYSVELESPQASTPASAANPAGTPAPSPAAKAETAPAIKSTAPAGGKTITSPLPGVIIEINVQEGQSVKKGGKVAVIEAMKMENEILAECDGTVSKIHVSKGDSVLEGANIVTIS